MENSNYLLYLSGTIKSLSKKNKQNIKKKFKEQSIIDYKSDGNQISIIDDTSVDVTNLELDDQLIKCIHESQDAVIEYEKWEFLKDYKYSVLFDLDNFKENVEKLNVKLEGEKNNEKDNCFEIINKPVKYFDEDRTILKFNLLFSAIHPLTMNELLLKYPFLVVFHIKEELVEFRFDGLKSFFREDKDYSKNVLTVLNYMKNSFDFELKPINLEFLVSVIKETSDDKVKLIAQYMQLASGGNAELNVGNNEEYVLPIIDELKGLISDFQTELDRIPLVRDALDQFIYEKEEMSNYPWIEVLWSDEIKTRSIHVKFIFNYKENNYCLIQHYFSNALSGMERMNHVTRYIRKNKQNITNTDQ